MQKAVYINSLREVAMTNKLQDAFEKASRLSEEEQDDIAEALLVVVDDTLNKEGFFSSRSKEDLRLSTPCGSDVGGGL